jgi:hypothetical protein
LTTRLEKTVLSKKIIEENLSQVEERAIKSAYRLSVGFERCEDKGEKSAPKFIPSSTYDKEEVIIKRNKAHYPSNSKAILQPNERSKERNSQVERGSFYLHVLWSCWSLV